MPRRELNVAETCCPDCPCKPESQACVARSNIEASVALVIDQPTGAEIKKDEFLAGGRHSHGAMIRAALASLDVDPDDLYICTATNCKPNIKKAAMLKKAMHGCRNRLIDELKCANVEKVLCIGPVGYSALMSNQKVEAITNIRGRWKHAFGMDIMATLPVGFFFAQPDYFRDFAFDVEKFFTTEPTPTPDVTLWRPESIDEVKEAFDFLSEFDHISCDLETTGFSPIDDEILSVGYCAILEDDSAVAVGLDDLMLKYKATWKMIARQLNGKQETVFHNGKFDLQFLKEQLTGLGMKYAPQGFQDTLLLHYGLDERPIGRFKSHGLETVARCRYDAPDYGITMKEFLRQWASAESEERRDELRVQLLTYNALDCYYTDRLYPDLWNEALESDEDLEDYWNEVDWDGETWGILDCYENILLPGAQAFADIEHHGVLIDRDMFEESRTTLERKCKRTMSKLQRMTGIKDFNPGSPKQVEHLLYNSPDDEEFPGLGLPFGLETAADGTVYHTARRGGLQEGPTAAPVIKALAYRFPEHEEVIDLICDYRNYHKNLGTYVNGIINRLHSDGRLRTSFNTAGTSTGRLSSSGPNLQNIPDASHTGIEIRGGFIAPPGFKILEADYKQLEVRIAAWLSDDPVMKDIFIKGRDCHQEIAFSIFKKPKGEISHYMRWLAKNILFGLLYGRGYESVATGPEQEDIARYGGERWSIEQVKEFFENLLAAWEEYAAWQQHQRQLGYQQHGIMMPTGRRRRFDFIPKSDAGYVGRASFNNPVQGVAADFTVAALIKLHARLPEGAHIISTVHDCIIVECPDELVQEVAALMHQIMEKEPLFDLGGVPLQIDLEISDRWGAKEELAHVMIEDEAA